MGHKSGWPSTLCEPNLLDKPVVLRPARPTDAHAWSEVRQRNAEWLQRWEVTEPEKSVYHYSVGSYFHTLAGMYREGLRRQAFPWLITFGDEFAGQLAVGSIVRGSSRSGVIGYWIDQKFAGRGIVPTALAMAVDHSFYVTGLHRLEAGIEPENHASRRVVEKLGFREEGLRRDYAHINGAWRDILFYAITARDLSGPLLPKWRCIVETSKSSKV